MTSRLVNVRLDEERLRKAQTLRESGVALSDLVREAIDLGMQLRSDWFDGKLFERLY